MSDADWLSTKSLTNEKCRWIELFKIMALHLSPLCFAGKNKGCVHNNGLPRAGFGITRHRYGRRDFSVALVYFLCDFDREKAKISQFRSLKSPL